MPFSSWFILFKDHVIFYFEFIQINFVFIYLSIYPYFMFEAKTVFFFLFSSNLVCSRLIKHTESLIEGVLPGVDSLPSPLVERLVKLN